MELLNFDAFKFATEFYQHCLGLKIPTHLRNQLDRASSSVALNLAEASGKNSLKERRRYYAIARGSFLEARAILYLVNPSINNTEINDKLGAILYRLNHPKN